MVDGRLDAAAELPEERLLVSPETLRGWQRSGLEVPRTLRGCVAELPRWDPALAARTGCRLPPELFARLDRSARLAVRAALEAWDAARTEQIDRSRVATVLGQIALPTESTNRFNSRLLLEPRFGPRPSDLEPAPHRAGAWAMSLPGAAVSAALGLAGGFCSIDAACASSLHAVAHGARLLRRGDVDAVLVGGVSGCDRLYTQLGFSALQALSRSGRCAPFDQRADGLLVGEGAAVFVLKRAAEALEQGDRILARLLGFGLSNDREGGLLAPSEEGQARCLTSAYRSAEIAPGDVDLVECHATGTPLGDAVEIGSLLRALGGAPPTGRPIVLGAVKGNLGHLLTGAGAAGLVNLLTALERRLLPPVAHFEKARESLGIGHGPLRILRTPEEWSRPVDRPRRAGINGFGFGGINAHLVLEEWEEPADGFGDGGRRPSGRSASEVPSRVAVASEGPQRLAAACDVVGLAARFGDGSGDALWGSLLGLGGPGSGGADAAIEELEVDPTEFRIPPRELQASMVQQLLALEVCKAALQDAGLLPTECRRDGHRLAEGERCGVYVALELDPSAWDFSLRWLLADRLAVSGRDGDAPDGLRRLCELLDADRTLGSLGGIVASRVAREFGIGGPAHGVAAAELGGAQALDMARQALAAGEIDFALVVGVDLACDPRLEVLRDSGARGDGAACLVLHSPRTTARREGGATPYARLSGLAVCGSGELDETLASPSRRERSVAASVRAARAAWREAGAEPDRAAWLELHAGGDPHQEALEHAALERWLGASGTAWPPAALPVASVRATTGNAPIASGLLAICRAALGLAEGIVPAGAVLRVGSGGVLAVSPRPSSPLVPAGGAGAASAGVQVMGSLGGSAHLVLQEAPPATAAARGAAAAGQRGSRRAAGHALFLFEAAGASGMAAAVGRLRELCETAPESGLTELSWRWRREHPVADGPGAAASHGASLRGGVVAHDVAELRRAVDELLRAVGSWREAADGQAGLGRSGSRWFLGRPVAEPGELAFVYPGSGNLGDPRLGELLAWFPDLVHAGIEERRFAEMLVPPVAFGWRQGSVAEQIQAQVQLGVLQRRLLRRLGVREQAAVGYSLGETTALFASGVWSDGEEMHRRMRQDDLFTVQLAGRCESARRAWSVAAESDFEWLAGVVPVGREELDRRLESWAGGARLARLARLIVNTDRDCVLGGERAAVEEFCRRFDLRLHPLGPVSAVHCSAVEPVRDRYRALHELDCAEDVEVRVYSAAWARAYAPSRQSCADSLLEQAVEGFDFPAVIRRAWEDGVRGFVEIGPGASCTRMIRSILDEAAGGSGAAGPHRVAPLVKALSPPTTPPLRSLLQLVADLWVRGFAVDPSATLRALGGVSAPAEHDPASGGRMAARRLRVRSRRPIEASLDAIAAGRSTAQRSATAASAEPPPDATREPSEPFESSESSESSCGAGVVDDGAAGVPRSLDRSKCLEFARGEIGAVLGASFAHVDVFPTRVRLPDEPLMLVDRVLVIEGQPGSLEAGRIVTEHDVLEAGWYLDEGRLPTAIAVEAGQADLLLSAFLGIDSQTRGERRYRLLDAVVTFERGLPRAGEVVHYDIRIERFFRQGDNWLFRFAFDATIDGEPLLRMRDGCAGFFSPSELAAGRGVVRGRLAGNEGRGVSRGWRPLLPETVEHDGATGDGVGALDAAGLEALRRGDLVAAFGPRYGPAAAAAAPVVTLPRGELELIDRVTRLEPLGGRHRLGLVEAEADIAPDDWFLTCHFVDDPVMPGTLMYECCLHTLRVLLLRLGWVGRRGEVCWEPVAGIASRLRCRGQVLPETRRAGYRVEIKEIGYGPAPYVLADAVLLADGREIVEIQDLSLQLSGSDRASLERLWRGAAAAVEDQPAARCAAQSGESSRQEAVGAASDDFSLEQALRPAVYDHESIVAFASGAPSRAFGAPYSVFDRERRIARLPRAPYQFLDRVVEVHGEPFVLAAGARCTAQWRQRPEDWTFSANRQDSLAFAALLEVALQPCGWLAAYCGSALTSQQDLSFRNLGGEATLATVPERRDDVLTTEVELTRTSASGGMIIQHFRFRVLSARVGEVYSGTTYFGFFPQAALANQVGLREARPWEPAADSPGSVGDGSDPVARLPSEAPFPAPSWRMIDRIEVLCGDGGRHGRGFVRGTIDVDPAAWFFEAHFFQDPVWPGSLGLEAFQQLLKLWATRYAAERASRAASADVARPGGEWRFTPAARGRAHRWTYRGQVTPRDRRVVVEASIRELSLAQSGPDELETEGTLLADGLLSVDGRVIYQIEELGFDFSTSLATRDARTGSEAGREGTRTAAP
mgnify:CR=1 FL=1